MRQLFTRTKLEYMSVVAMILTFVASRLFDDFWMWVWTTGGFIVIFALREYRLKRMSERPVADASGDLQRE